jgi:hypothetical protein
MFTSFSHKRRLKELEEAVQKLTRDFQSLELTWLDTSHKLKSILGRVTKSEALAKEKEDALMGTPPPSLADWPGGRNGGMLTDAQKKIQQQILRRRGGG